MGERLARLGIEDGGEREIIFASTSTALVVVAAGGGRDSTAVGGGARVMIFASTTAGEDGVVSIPMLVRDSFRFRTRPVATMPGIATPAPDEEDWGRA